MILTGHNFWCDLSARELLVPHRKLLSNSLFSSLPLQAPCRLPACPFDEDPIPLHFLVKRSGGGGEEGKEEGEEVLRMKFDCIC